MARSNRNQGSHASIVRRLTEELEIFFLNEVVDERLADVEITGLRLARDKKTVTLSYLPPEGSEDVVAGGLESLRPALEERLAEILRRRPSVGFRYDRGASNERRVEEILDELRAKGELPDTREPDSR